MTTFMKRLGYLAFPAAALTMSAAGLAAGSGAATNDDGARNLPVDCEISVSRDRYGHTFEGRVRASRNIAGTYELSITNRGGGGSAMISQSGEFHVAKGTTETLGQATFGGLRPDMVDAELTIHWNGETLFCSNHSET